VTAFDPGYGAQPFRDLCADAPGTSVYPGDDFRVEWGPIFHRGRLDGSARVLVIGQDPAQHETITRRILMGEAGHRLQGFLAKLGIDRSYVLVNTYLYSVYGQRGGTKHRNDPNIAAYRNRWFDALLAPGKAEAVVALGSLADSAWRSYTAHGGSAAGLKYRRITHPTEPESASGGDSSAHAAAIKAMLANWNDALQALHPLAHPDSQRPLKLYGTSFAAGDKIPIPADDLPPGLPEWMRLDDGWADRTGSGRQKRATIRVVVPGAFLP
jgi:uracil DNA glycosylase superfamily protein